MIVSDFLQTYLGKPYGDCDCWDIVKLFYSKVLEIDMSLPMSYGIPEDSKEYRKKISKVVEMHKCDFKEVETPSFGDIILFDILGTVTHVGVYIGGTRFIHSIKEAGCCVESLPRWARKIRGYYRWPK